MLHGKVTSFSGLKTAVLRWVQEQDMSSEIAARKSFARENRKPAIEDWVALTPQTTLDMIAAFQNTVIEELLRRSIRSADELGAFSIIVSGGVAGNAGLRAAAQRHVNYKFYFPSRGLATDNAAMIAAAAFPKFDRGEFADFDLRAQASLTLA